MQIELKKLLNDYADEMHAGNAALFIGAGLSRPGGFVDWKGLLFEIAKEIDLEIEREHDLVAVVQYYLNRRGGDRSYLNKVLKRAFDKSGVRTENHKIIARLPISTIWTTNFDRLIETALTETHRSHDVKSRDEEIAQSTRGRDVILYKMHGDIAEADRIIICEDDYERYARRHPIFQNVLEGDLLTKTFLFLGFSFADPNLKYMLGHLRSLLGSNKRQHYTIMRKVRYKWAIDEAKAQEDFEYDTNKQTLQVANLDRYSIDTHLVVHYDQVTEILRALESKYYERNVYVCPEANRATEPTSEKLHTLCQQLGRRLIKKNRSVCTDFRSGIGRSLLAGALPEIDSNELSVEKYLLSPPPTNLSFENEADFRRIQRQEMMRRCGFAIYLGGSGVDCEQVMFDFEFSKGSGRPIPIPIAASGLAARDIWEKMLPRIDAFYGNSVPRTTFERLNDNALDVDQLLAVVFEIIEKVSSAKPKLSERFDEETQRTVFAELRKNHPTLSLATLRQIVGELRPKV